MNKLQKINREIIKTLTYSDIFDYPLTRNEIYKYLGIFCSQKDFNKSLNQLLNTGFIRNIDGFYVFRDRKFTVSIRNSRKRVSMKKNKIAKKIANFLSLIPTIKYIGVSGSLSLNNAKQDDDIDLFFITKKNSLWITRFLVNALLITSGVKRVRGAMYASDKVCPNMFMEEESLAFSKNRQSLFSAREIVQLKTIYDAGGVYKSFLNSNRWINDFLPNIYIGNDIANNNSSSFVLNFVNDAMFVIQYFYMMKKITNEDVRLKIAGFHPKNTSEFVLELHAVRFKNNMRKLSLDTKINSHFNADTPGY